MLFDVRQHCFVFGHVVTSGHGNATAANAGKFTLDVNSGLCQSTGAPTGRRLP